MCALHVIIFSYSAAVSYLETDSQNTLPRYIYKVESNTFTYSSDYIHMKYNLQKIPLFYFTLRFPLYKLTYIKLQLCISILLLSTVVKKSFYYLQKSIRNTHNMYVYVTSQLLRNSQFRKIYDIFIVKTYQKTSKLNQTKEVDFLAKTY